MRDTRTSGRRGRDNRGERKTHAPDHGYHRHTYPVHAGECQESPAGGEPRVVATYSHSFFIASSAGLTAPTCSLLYAHPLRTPNEPRSCCQRTCCSFYRSVIGVCRTVWGQRRHASEKTIIIPSIPRSPLSRYVQNSHARGTSLLFKNKAQHFQGIAYGTFSL